MTDALGNRKHLIHTVTTWYEKPAAKDKSMKRIPANPHNADYLNTKARRFGHQF